MLRVSVIEIIKDTARDLLSDRPSKIEFADSNDSLITSCNEIEFSSLDEFKSVVPFTLLLCIDCCRRFN